MARRNRDLAGLAALGALGYMMSRKPTNNAPVEDRRAAALQAVARLQDDRDVGGISGASPSGLYRNEETGDLFSMNIPERAPARRPAGPSRSMAAADTAEEMAPPAAVPQEVPSRGRRELPPRRNVAGDYTRRMGATADEIAAYRTREITPPPMTPAMRKQAEEQAIQRVTPEEYLIGGPGLKGLHAAAKRLAAPRVAEYTQPLLAAPTARLTGPSKKDLVARDRAARDAMRREEMLQENARRYGLDPSAPGYEGAARAVREGLGDGAFTLKKKGGMVKAKPKKMASGGSTSSTSKRGDGIASRGKTKCKMY